MTQQLAQWACFGFAILMIGSLFMRWVERAGDMDSNGFAVHSIALLVWIIFTMLLGEAGTFTMIF